MQGDEVMNSDPWLQSGGAKRSRQMRTMPDDRMAPYPDEDCSPTQCTDDEDNQSVFSGPL